MRRKSLILGLALCLAFTPVVTVLAEETTEEATTEEAAEEAAEETTEEAVEEAEIPEVVPVTWDVSPEHLMIEGDEARELYERIVAGDYPTLEELKGNTVVKQLDALAAYYKELYGNTADIDTPERQQIREEILNDFLSHGAARTESVDENDKHHYVYDGELKEEYKMELVLGLPASGKSTRVVDPDSEEMGAFIFDPDMIKEALPEYKESHGAGADAVHFEGMNILAEARKAFLEGDMKGTNIILPLVSTDINDLLDNYIHPFEEAGYHVKVKFCPAEPNEAAARVVMRELAGGQLINSNVAFNFGYAPEEVYNELAGMLNADGEPYGYEAEEELQEAA